MAPTTLNLQSSDIRSAARSSSRQGAEHSLRLSRPGYESEAGAGSCRRAPAGIVLGPVVRQLLRHTRSHDPIEDLGGARIQLVACQALKGLRVLRFDGVEDFAI